MPPITGKGIVVERINQWLTLVANLGVLAGIIFLAIEIQQNTDVTRSTTAQEISNTSVEFFMRVAESPDLARVIKVATENPGGLSEVEIVQYEYHTGAAFMLFEGAYKQFQLGFLPESGWKPHEGLIKYLLDNPVSRNWWVNSNTVFSPEFENRVIAVSGVKRKST